MFIEYTKIHFSREKTIIFATTHCHIETQRLRLRPWQEDDAPTLFKYASEPEVGERAARMEDIELHGRRPKDRIQIIAELISFPIVSMAFIILRVVFSPGYAIPLL